jgi:hypothetical protein
MTDFATLGQQVKQKTGAYTDLPDETVGQLYMKKTNPLQYELMKQEQTNQVNLQQTQAASDIQAQKELDVSGKKMQQEYDFKAAHPDTAITATDKKNQLAATATETFVKSLENKFASAGGGTFGIGPGARIKGAIESLKGSAGLNQDASVYNDSKEGFAATLKALTGDTGVMTDQDYARLSKLLPGLGSTKKEATDKFNQLREQVAAKFGGQKQETAFKPKTENNRGALASVLDIPFGSAVNLAEKSQADLSNQLKTGQYKNIMDLISPKTSKDVGLLQDVAPAGIETGLTAMTIGSVGSGAKKLLENVFGGKAKAIVGREVAANAVKSKVSTDSILQAGDKYISQDPTAAQLWTQKLRPALETQKELSVPDLLQQIKIWNDAYSSAGKVGKTALAGLNDALARSAKDVIKKEAPEVAQYTAKLAKIYGLEKFFSRFGGAALGAGGAVVGATILGKAMGQKTY